MSGAILSAATFLLDPNLRGGLALTVLGLLLVVRALGADPLGVETGGHPDS